MADLLHFAPARPGEPAPDFGLGSAGFEAWRAFIVAHALVTRRLDEELRASHGITLGDYDALVQLAYAPERTLRMSALADRVLLSRSGVTRLVDRLVAAGLVERTTCASDARGSFAVLTAAGLDTLRRASVTHLRGVREHFLAALPDARRRELADALEAIVIRVAGPAETEGCTSHAAVADAAGRAARLDPARTRPDRGPAAPDEA